MMECVEGKKWYGTGIPRREGFSPSSWLDLVKFIKKEYPDTDWATLCNNRTVLEYQYRIMDAPFTPAVFKSLCTEWIKAFGSKKVLIPRADGSEGILPQKGECIDYVFLNNSFREAAQLFMSINVLDELPHDMQYDLILSDLPMGAFGGSQSLYQVVEDCISFLADDGYCLFTFPIGISSETGKKWLEKLSCKGGYCLALSFR